MIKRIINIQDNDYFKSCGNMWQLKAIKKQTHETSMIKRIINIQDNDYFKSCGNMWQLKAIKKQTHEN